MSSALESALHWEGLAEAEDRMGAHEASLGRFAGVHANKADLYRRTAKSLRLEAADGVVRCVCCLNPQSDHTDYWKRK